MPTAIVFGHADGDGHLAAEQSRTNLQANGINVSRVVVGPETRNYRFWEQTFSQWNFKGSQLVYVVDIAFSFRDPKRSLKTVVQVADDHPATQFVVIDHHPLKLPPRPRPNLKLVEVSSAYDCCVGTPSDDLMVVAAICDRDETSVRSRLTMLMKKRAIGVRRAAADTCGVAGPNLLMLLRDRRWDFFEALADEPADFHILARGRRRACSADSPMLEAAKIAAL